MITANKKIPALTINRTDTVVIDFSAWAREPGTLQIWHRPCGAPVAHKAELTVTGSKAYWTASVEDASGMGDAMVVYNKDSGSVRKSNVFPVMLK